MKSRINDISLIKEEKELLENGDVGNTSYATLVYNTAKKFFYVLITSYDRELLKYTEIVKDSYGYDRHYFHEYFRGEDSAQKIDFNIFCLTVVFRLSKIVFVGMNFILCDWVHTF